MRLTIPAAIAALALTSCAGMRGDQAARMEAAQVGGEQSLEEMTRNAESQTGQLAAITDDELRINKHARRGGDETRLEISEAEVPVFMEGARVGRAALRQGEDVRVYYESGRGANPRVIAVEVLTDDEASRLREP